MKRSKPSLLRRWLEWALPPEVCESVLGDLEEERAAQRRRGRFGRAGTAIWVRMVAVGIVLDFVLAETRRRIGSRRSDTFISAAIDWRLAWRRLFKAPAASAVTVLTLAVAIALNALLLAVLHAALVQPISFPQPEELVDILATRTDRPQSRSGMTPADYLALRERTTSFSSFAGYVPFGSFEMTGEGDPVLVERFLVGADFFGALRVAPVLGRTFTPAEEVPGADRVVVLSWDFWRGRLGGRPEIVGETLRLDGEPHTVLGVMPAGFGARGGSPDLWAPLSFGPHRPADRHTAYVGVIARLAADTTLSAARSELDRLALELARELPETNGKVRSSALPLAEVMTSGIRPLLGMLLAGGLLVLIVALANVTNVQLASGFGRRGEFRLRAVLGASRLRLARQVLVEVCLFVVLAGIAGSLLSVLLVSLLPDLRGQILHGFVELNIPVPVFSLAWSLLAVLAVAMAVPLIRQAVAASGGASAPSLAERRAMRRLPELLVSLQTAACLLLLLGAGLTLRSIAHLQRVDLGYAASELIVGEISVPRSRYPDGAAVQRLVASLRERLPRLPGVSKAGFGNALPGAGWTFRPGVADRAEAATVSASWVMVDRSYLETLDLPLLAGRTFTATDTSDSAPVMVVSRALAAGLFGEDSPLGRRLDFGRAGAWHEVVGVVGDVRSGPAESPTPTAYVLYEQHQNLIEEANLRRVTLLVSAPSSAVDLLPTVRAEIAAVDSQLPLANAGPLSERLQQSVFRPRMSSIVLTTFALLALCLAILGIYGVLALSVLQRQAELGVRMALGATAGELVRATVGRGMLLATLGLLLGFGVWIPLRRLADSLVYGIATNDPLTHLVAPLVLLLAGLITAWLPARKIARIDPARSLRGER